MSDFRASGKYDRWNIAHGWFATDGSWHEVSEETRQDLHQAMGVSEEVDVGASDDIRFVRQGSALPLNTPVTIILEDGSEMHGTHHLPRDLPLGAHQAFVHKPLPQGLDEPRSIDLFVVPPRQALPSRSWALAAQLYAARSADSWGHGDFADLAILAEKAATLGAGFVAHNPLGASAPLPQQQPSPYFPSSRRNLSHLYLNVENVPGVETCATEVASAAAAGRALNSGRLIDRDRVHQLKVSALQKIWAQVRRSDTVRSVLESGENRDYSLRQHATFCAISEAFGTGWRQWPTALRHPDSPAVSGFCLSNRDRVDFWHWVNVQTDSQLRKAATAGAGLIGDLAVGFDPDGFDAWADQDLLAKSCSIGAPGDDFNPGGQNWGLPPYVPWRLRRAGYKPWIATLRHVLRYCTGLRIDHIMGLFRLFWIPDGSDAAKGAYVYQFGSELLDLALMEATRAGVWLAGEDLGTVEPEVRHAMAERQIPGYTVALFEDEPPPKWPVASVASLTTHDLPTVAGLWTGGDANSRRHAGQAVDEGNDAQMSRRLRSLSKSDSSLEEVILSAHDALAGSASQVALTSLEDTQAVVERPNLPGTVDENPNWRLALPVALDDLDGTLLPRIADSMRRHGR